MAVVTTPSAIVVEVITAAATMAGITECPWP